MKEMKDLTETEIEFMKLAGHLGAKKNLLLKAMEELIALAVKEDHAEVFSIIDRLEQKLCEEAEKWNGTTDMATARHLAGMDRIPKGGSKKTSNGSITKNDDQKIVPLTGRGVLPDQTH